MKLDSRIKEGKKPLTCFDIEIAKQFLGKKGYFSNYLNVYAHISNMKEDVLQSLDENLDENHDEAFLEETRSKWKFFLPAEWVKQEKKEPKYRPYSLAEWIEQHGIGEVIHYRSKSEGIELRHMYMGYAFGTGKDITKLNVGTLTLGVASYCFDYLFEDYEIEINNKWKPFGVLENGNAEKDAGTGGR